MADWEAGRPRLPPPIRVHLEAMTGPHGIYQHARGPLPDLAHGTCTDDVARALGVDLLQARVLGWPAVAASARRLLDYVLEAFDERTGRFRNFRADEGTWLPGEGSQDCHGRAMVALAEVTVRFPERIGARNAAAVLGRACPAASELTALRGVASALLACVIAERGDGAGRTAGAGAAAQSGDAPAGTGPVRRTLELLAGRLATRMREADDDPAWPWPEPVVTYESALVPRALVAAGTLLGRPDLVALGQAGLDWLISNLIDAEGRFHPVGNRGWWPRSGSPARFDQQPIEAGAMIQAAATALEATGEPRYLAAVNAAFAWFTGRNDLGISLAVPERGACRDGLEPDGPNENQGAESTLAWLAAVEHLRWMPARTDIARSPGAPEPRVAAGATSGDDT